MKTRNKMAMILSIIAVMMACTVSVVIADDSQDSDATITVNEIATFDRDYTYAGIASTNSSSVITSSTNGGQFLATTHTYHINWICVSGSVYQTSSNSLMTVNGMSVSGSIVTPNNMIGVSMQLSGTPSIAGDWYASMSVTYTKISDSSTVTVIYGIHLSIDSGYTYTARLAYINYNNGGYTTYSADERSVTQATQGATGSYTFTVSSFTPTKTGYTFRGWASSESSNVVSYVAGDTVTVNYGSAVGLYALWQANTNTYYANLYYSGYSQYNTYYTMTGTSASGSHTFTITDRTFGYIDGDQVYTIVGWSTSAGSTTATYAPSSTISVAFGSSVTLYPVYSVETRSYTVSFDSNGGSGTISDIDGNMGETIVLPSSGFTRSGYSLAGWSTYMVTSTAEYDLGDSFVVNADKTLYAVWRAVTAPVASFTSQVDADDTLKVNFTDKSIGAVVWQWTFGDTVTSTQQNPSHTYQEAGSYTVKLTVTNSTQQTSTYSLMVTVGADPNTQYIITFDYGDGSGSIPELQGLYMSYLLLPDATYSGHTFVGWYLDEVFVGNTSSEYQVTGNVTLVAHYEVGVIEIFKVTFVSGGTLIAVQKITSGGYATSMRGDSNKELIGWFDSNENAFNFSTPITSDLTLTAKYTGGSDPSFPDIGMVGWAIIAAIIIICVGAAIKWLK